MNPPILFDGSRRLLVLPVELEEPTLAVKLEELVLSVEREELVQLRFEESDLACAIGSTP